MSTLSFIEKQAFEDLLNMSSGYVLDFSDRTFAEFFKDLNVDIYANKYADLGTSKAKRLRSFWSKESDQTVAVILEKLIDVWVHLNRNKVNDENEILCRKIIERIKGIAANTEINSEAQFLKADFGQISFVKLKIEPSVIPYLSHRLQEVSRCISSKAYLSAVIILGSILEGALLGVAQSEPALFNKAKSCPKDNSKKPKLFHSWTLSELIDVACECKLINKDVQKYSQNLRSFRNYIHPYEQMASQFTPDEHTVNISFQVLRAAIADLSKERTKQI